MQDLLDAIEVRVAAIFRSGFQGYFSARLATDPGSRYAEIQRGRYVIVPSQEFGNSVQYQPRYTLAIREGVEDQEEHVFIIDHAALNEVQSDPGKAENTIFEADVSDIVGHEELRSAALAMEAFALANQSGTWIDQL